MKALGGIMNSSSVGVPANRKVLVYIFETNHISLVSSVGVPANRTVLVWIIETNSAYIKLFGC